jgi:arginyl-tRNA synthetase
VALAAPFKECYNTSVMTYSLDQLQQDIATQIKTLLKTDIEPVVQLSNPKVGSDVAVPCFVFARELAQNPQAIASKVVNGMQHDAIARTEAIAGFVNIWLKPEVLVQMFADDILKADDDKKVFGESGEGAGKTVIVEFPSPNMAKPFGVGHLRPANQGWAIYKMMQAMGYTVVGDSHLGDWGTPFGKWAVGFTEFSSEEQLEKDGIYELARVYIKITAEMKYEAEHNKHELADKVQNWLLKLENGDTDAAGLSDRFHKISLDHIHAVQDRLKIHTDEELGESFYIPEGKRMIKELVEKGVATQQEDGSVIVPLDEYNIETPMLIQKSNGAALYATSDIATIKYRWERWKPAKVIYMVGEEQRFHFQQIFAFADKVGYNKMELIHLWWGTLDQLNEDGSRSKMSSRKGTILLEELINKAESKARQVAGPQTQASADDIKKIAIGAIKFNDFSADRRTGILFDWTRMFNLQGFSGPYVQYAGVRISGILNKFDAVTNLPFDGTYDWEGEKELLFHLLQYPQILRDAATNYEAHRIALFAYDLARLLNRYYEEVSIAKSPANLQHKRLWLLGYVQKIHAHALDLLGIEVPGKM